MTDLRTLLELATDEIAGADLSRSALATARRRRVRRRGTAAGVAAGLAVASAVVVPQVLDGADRAAPGEEVPTSPTATGSPDATPTPVDLDGLAPVPDGARHPVFDPDTAAGLPYYPIESLPEVVAPVGGSSSRPGDREGPLALSRSHNDRLAILFPDRGWYGLKRLDEAGDLWDSALSRDGERAAVVGEGGLFWCDATEICPSWTRVDVPDVGDDARLTWTRDSNRVVVSGSRTAYLVDLDGEGHAERPELGGGAAFDFAPDGELVTLDGVTSLVAFEDGIVATRVSDDGDDGLVLLDRDGRTVEKFLPVEGDVAGMVAHGQLRPVQWLNKLTVLFEVRQDDTSAKEDLVHLVTWDHLTFDEYGEPNHGRVAWYPATYDVSLRDLYPA